MAGSDVLALESEGVTYKVDGATLAVALKTIGGYVSASDYPIALANGGTGAATAAGARANLSLYSRAETDALLGTKVYGVRGVIVSSAVGGTARGVGKATVAVVGKTVIVTFAAKIAEAGTVSSAFDVGVSVAGLRQLNADIPAFEVCDIGSIAYFDENGALSEMNGYAGAGNANVTTNRWNFGRVYRTDGSVGMWDDSKYAAGQMIMGTLFGTLN